MVEDQVSTRVPEKVPRVLQRQGVLTANASWVPACWADRFLANLMIIGSSSGNENSRGETQKPTTLVCGTFFESKTWVYSSQK